jgi:alpha-beta hydrolase superfamily lysophospholipase
MRADAITRQFTITTNDARAVKITAWPAAGKPKGLVLFSHGALSSPWKYKRLLQPWADAGFAIYAPLHVDSTEYPGHARYDMLGSWRARIEDMRALAAHINHKSYIAAGHSYGGLMALTLAGAKATIPSGVSGPLADPRVKAVIAFSPPGPTAGLITRDGYASIGVPALIETGDQDIPFNMKNGDWRVHLAAFDAARNSDIFALELPSVNHYFGNIICRPDLPGPSQTAQFADAVKTSVLFLNAYGGDSATSMATFLNSRYLVQK